MRKNINYDCYSYIKVIVACILIVVQLFNECYGIIKACQKLSQVGHTEIITPKLDLYILSICFDINIRRIYGVADNYGHMSFLK